MEQFHEKTESGKHEIERTLGANPSLHLVVQLVSILKPSTQLGDGAFETTGALHVFGLHVHVDDNDPAVHVTDSILGVYAVLHFVVHELPDEIDVP
jgi:hypothetical protein